LGVKVETTPYLIKTSVLDWAGNILKSSNQSFVVDLEFPELSYTPGQGFTGSTGQQNFTTISFKSSEAGNFASNSLVIVNGSPALSQNTFTTNELKLDFTDLAGNSALTLSNGSQTWKFQNTNVSLIQGPSSGALVDLIGSVGKYSMSLDLEMLDVSSLYDTRSTLGEKAAINHISSVGGGLDVITISMDDVLALAVRNSFTTSGQLQMRIDGDSTDKVFLDNMMGTSSELHWAKESETTLDGQQYSVYTNTDLGLELFIHQGLQVTAVL
jgi:hypothetical protein